MQMTNFDRLNPSNYDFWSCLRYYLYNNDNDKNYSCQFFKLLNTKLRKHFHRFKCHLNKVNYFYRAHTAFSAKIYGNERISILCHEFKIKLEIIATQKKDDITMTLRKTLGKNEQTVKRECTNFGRS